MCGDNRAMVTQSLRLVFGYVGEGMMGLAYVKSTRLGLRTLLLDVSWSCTLWWSFYLLDQISLVLRLRSILSTTPLCWSASGSDKEYLAKPSIGFNRTLTDRSMYVSVHGSISEPVMLDVGHPHRSMLGPTFDSNYTQPMVDWYEYRFCSTTYTLTMHNYSNPWNDPVIYLLPFPRCCMEMRTSHPAWQTIC